MPNSGVGYAIYVSLVARQAPLILPEYQIKTDWDDQIALVQIDERGPTCKLGWLEYPRSEILNQGFENFLRFHYCGQMLEGTILATGVRPIPPAYRTGAQVPFRLRLADPLGHEIGVEGALYVQRKRRMPLCDGGLDYMSHWDPERHAHCSRRETFGYPSDRV